MSIITISREVGSEGSLIAQKVAEALGYHFADKGMIARVLKQYGLVEFDQEYDSIPTFWDRLNAQREQRRDLIVNMLNRVVLALAQHGHVVILGRGSFAVLRGFTDVLNVRVQAPLPLRVERVMRRENIADSSQAEALVKEGDRVRVAFIESFYGVRPDAAGVFDLVIDTGKISSDLATTWLIEATRALDRASHHECTIAAIQVDSLLASVVAAELKCEGRPR